MCFLVTDRGPQNAGTSKSLINSTGSFLVLDRITQDHERILGNEKQNEEKIHESLQATIKQNNDSRVFFVTANTVQGYKRFFVF
jgi:hypothetical protein